MGLSATRAAMVNVTKEQVMEHFNYVDKFKTSFVDDLSQISIWDAGEMDGFKLTIKDTEYPLTTFALKQLLKKLKIPFTYFQSCSFDLRNQELQEAFSRLSNETNMNFKLWLDEETNKQWIYGMLDPDCADLMSGEIVQKVLDGMGSEAGVVIPQFTSTLEGLKLRFINENNQYTDVDAEFPGVDFKFSEVGDGPISLQSVLLRKVCSNGLVIPQEINSAFKMTLKRYEPSKFDMEVQYVENAASGLEAISNALLELKNIVLPEALIDVDDKDMRNAFDDVFEYVVPKKSVRKDYGRLIRTEFNTAGNLTVNGLVNATTKIAQEKTRNIDSYAEADLRLDVLAEKNVLESSAGSFVSKIAVMDEHAKADGGRFDYSLDGIKHSFKKYKKLKTTAD